MITGAPSELDYGAQFQVDTPDPAAITDVTLIRLGAVTHAFDENQRFMRPNSMLFILNGQGIPSVAKIVRL